MQWWRSAGGPLLVLPVSTSSEWHGAYGPGGDDDVDEDETPYWTLVEQVQDYAGVVDVGGRGALVLANGRADTCFLERRLLFVQCLTTGSEDDVERAAADALARVTWSVETTWRVDDACVMFDSALYGPALEVGDYLSINVPGGTYAVRSAYVDPGVDGASTLALTQLSPTKEPVAMRRQ